MSSKQNPDDGGRISFFLMIFPMYKEKRDTMLDSKRKHA